MLFNRNIHIVSHTHWDREWYFSTCDSLVLLDQVVSDILVELEHNQNVNFCLDGQVSIVEEYLKLYPEKLTEIQKRVSERRLFIGPWYTQSDTQLISGASIVGNLYYGIYKSLQLVHDYMKIGYLPDTFGFSNQMPMILHQFGIDNLIFWRGVDFKKQKIEPYFTWIGQDQSEVSGIVLHNGYGMAKGFNTSEAFIDHKLKPLIEEYKQLTSANDILIPVGNDQSNIVSALDKKIKAVSDDLVISDYESFVKEITPQITTKYQGEFREVKYSRIHKTCGGIRIDIKKSNYDAEIALTYGLEPLNVMAGFEGMSMSNLLIQEAWKYLYEGQAHDGAVGCVSDNVSEDIVNRNKQALEIAKSGQNYLKQHFAKRMQLRKDELLLFNLEATPFKGYKEVEIFSSFPNVVIEGVDSQAILSSICYEGNPNALVETPEGNHYEVEPAYYLHRLLIEVELPSFGYQVFKFKETSDMVAETTGTVIANDVYQIAFQDGRVSLTYEGKTITDFIGLYDRGNTGDTYDFSPLEGETEIKIAFQDATICKKANVEIMKLSIATKLPKTLADRKQHCYNQTCYGTLELQLRHDDLIHVSLDFDNQVHSHQLRVAFKGLAGSNHTFAATPYGTVVREVLNQPFTTGWEDEYMEYPIDVETNSGFVSFYGDGKQLTVFNKGIKEYQALQDQIYMTLFSACDELGKPDLLYRPGRASGDTTKKGHIRMQTPLAQVLGKHHFEFAVSFMSNDSKVLYQTLATFEVPSVFYQNQELNLFYERIDNKIQMLDNRHDLQAKKSYLCLEGAHVSSIYTSLYDHTYKLRVMCFEDKQKDDIIFSKEFRVGNLLEQGEEKILKAYRLYTIRGVHDEDK